MGVCRSGHILSAISVFCVTLVVYPMLKHFLLAASFFLSGIAFAAEEPLLMTTRGKLLVDQDFSAPLKPFDGVSNGFASGFSGWRWNAVPRGGKWEVAEGVFTGRETPEVKHPATASYGFRYQNVIIQCQVRMNDVPLDGRRSRSVSIRTVDAKDYVCSLYLNEAGFRISKDDNDHGGPDKAVPLGAVKTGLKLDEWHTVVMEILGDEMVGTVNGRSLTGSHPLIAAEKHSLMFVMAAEGSVRNLKVWEALPNPAWAKNKAALAASGSAAAKP